MCNIMHGDLDLTFAETVKCRKLILSRDTA